MRENPTARWRVLTGFVVALGLWAGASPALAQSCDTRVVDSSGAVSNVSRVETAARSIEGAEVRVRVVPLSSVSGGNLDKWAESQRAACGAAWSSPNGQVWKANFLLLAVGWENDKPGQIGMYYGSQLQPRIGNGKYQDILRDALNPGIRAQKREGDKEGLTRGLVASLGEVQGLMARPINGGGTTVVKQATDFSGLWSFMRWALLLVCIGLVAYGAFWYLGYQRLKQLEKDRWRNARRLATETRNTLLEFIGATNLAVLQAKVDQLSPDWKRERAVAKMATVKAYVTSGLDHVQFAESTSLLDSEKRLTASDNRTFDDNMKLAIDKVKQIRGLISQIESGDLGVSPEQERVDRMRANADAEQRRAREENRRREEEGRRIRERVAREQAQADADLRWGASTRRNNGPYVPRNDPPPSYSEPRRDSSPGGGSTVNNYGGSGGGFDPGSAALGYIVGDALNRRSPPPPPPPSHSDSGGSWSSPSSSYGGSSYGGDSGGSWSDSSSSSGDSGGSSSSD